MVIRVIKTFLVWIFCAFLPCFLNLFCLLGPYISVLHHEHPCMKCSLDISNFLDEISSLSHSTVFSISLHCSLKKAFLSLLAILWNSAFIWVYLSLSPLPLWLASLFFSATCRPPQTTTLHSYISFSLGWFWSLPPTQCYEPPSIVLQALFQSDRIHGTYSSPPLYNNKEFDLDHTSVAQGLSLLCSI